MLLQRVVNYIHGSVRVRVSGAVPEKFVNLCLARGIILWRITKSDDAVLASLRLPDFFRVRPLAKASRNHVAVVARSGCPFVAGRVKRRKMLIIGAILFLFLLYTLSAYVWFVDVAGSPAVSGDKVRSVAAQNGLKAGVGKERVNIRAVENAILLNVPEIAWVGIQLTGTRAVIEVVEKTLSRPEDKSPADIIAAKAGVITEILAISGQPVVKKGDTVKKGDILIKGLIPTEPAVPSLAEKPQPAAPPRLTRANGIVKARIWYEGYGESGLTRETRQRTGRQEIGVLLKVQENILTLKGFPPAPYQYYETETVHKKLPVWRNSGLTVESTINIAYELGLVVRDITPDEAREIAKGNALQMVQTSVPEGAQVLTRHYDTKTAETGLVRVKVTVETVEDIGQIAMINQ